MHLLGKNQLLRLKAHSLAKDPVILPDIFRLIAPVDAEIQRRQVPFGDAAVAGRKAMDDPRLPQERRLQIFQFSGTNDFKAHD